MTHGPLPQTIQLIRQGQQLGQHIGAQLYVSLDGKPLIDWADGESRPGTPMRVDTLVPFLSAGKPLTAVAIAQLWEQHKLDLDDRVARFIPEFAAHGKGSITIRHLLTHTGGFRGVALTPSASDWEFLVKQVAASRLETGWIPGQMAGYHVNSSWIALGEIIRRITSIRADAYLRQAVLQPLGMNDTWLTLDASSYAAYSQANRIALIPHTGPDVREAARPSLTNTPQGAATLLPGQTARGPIRELGRFYEMLLNRGEMILGPQAVEAITARHRTGLFDLTFKHTLDWGLGLILNSEFYPPHHAPYGFGPHASRRTFGHGGRQTTLGMCDPEHRLVVAMALNGMPGEMAHNQRAYDIMRTLYQELGLSDKTGSPQR